MDTSLIPGRWVVVEVFKKYHSGLTEDHIHHKDNEEFERMVHSDSSFWDRWKPCKFRAEFTNLRSILTADNSKYSNEEVIKLDRGIPN
jgi:hypothetical protein